MKIQEAVPNTCKPGPTSWKNLSYQEIIDLNTYDFMAYLGKRVINPGGVRGREQVLDLLKPKPGSRVLEIGGGSGHAACHIARKYQCSVTTIDISPRSIHEAEQLVEQENLKDLIRCEVGDVNSLKFDNESFDHVICQAVIMFVDQSKALAEVQRVLGKEGTFAGLEFSWKKNPIHEVRENTYRICGCKKLEFHSPAIWKEKLLEAGFDRVTCDEQPFSLLSLRGFLRDEGLGNCLQIASKVLRRRANIVRMSEIWAHFSRNIEYFSYTVFSGKKL